MTLLEPEIVNISYKLKFYLVGNEDLYVWNFNSKEVLKDFVSMIDILSEEFRTQSYLEDERVKIDIISWKTGEVIITLEDFKGALSDSVVKNDFTMYDLFDLLESVSD